MPASPTDSTARDGRLPRLAWLLLGISAAWCVLWFVHALGYWEDDAYIHLEFARSLAAGRGFSFNGHVVYGDTSPLWAWLLAAFHAVIPSWMAAGKTLSVVAAIFALSGAFVFARALTRQRLGAKNSAIFAAAMVLVFVSNPYFAYWAFSGMEALAAAGLACWGLVAVMQRQLSPLRFLTACIIGGIAPLLRPEMAFFTVLLGLLLLERLLRMTAPLPRRMLLFCAGAAWLIAPFALWARYAVHTFGSVLPNTNAAKRAAVHDSVAVHLAGIYALGFPVVVLGVLLLAVWIVSRLRDHASRPRSPWPLLPAAGWLLFVWTGVNCVFYVADHTYVQTRYIFVTAPPLTIALLALAAQAWPRIARGLTALALVSGFAISLLTTWPLLRNKVEIDRIYAELAGVLRTLPPGAPVAHFSIGEAAFLSEHPIVDTGGITRPGIIPYLNDPTPDRRLDWIYSQGAQYLVGPKPPGKDAVLIWHHLLPVAGWYMDPRRYREADPIELWKLPPRSSGQR